MTNEQIAQVCHEANRGLQVAAPAVGIPVAAPWDEFTDRASIVSGVAAIRANLNITPEESHDLWCAYKHGEGWRHGPVKDAAAKTHPCLVPYDELPPENRIKDELFGAIVRVLA